MTVRAQARLAAEPQVAEMMARSRLSVPPPRRSHLHRERLFEALVTGSAPFVLLSAPAGSGKTALAAEWADSLVGSRDFVWVNCQVPDADPWPDVLLGMAASPAPADGPGHARVHAVLDAAYRSSRPWTLFLDGYELRAPQLAEELEVLLQYAGSALQVVVTTRVDPVLPLHRYRLDGTLLELRVGDLAFTDAEALALLHEHGVELEPGDVHALNTRLGGWAAGLRFAIPTLAGRSDPAERVWETVTANGNINAFLVEEVLNAQPPRVRELVLATCVPDRLSPGLMEELTGEPAGPLALELMRSNVFLEDHPGSHSSLQYTPFFRELVRAQLAYEAPEQSRELQRRVADWNEARHGSRPTAPVPDGPPKGVPDRMVEALTPRELEVLIAMSEWLSTEEIAATLFVSVNTVRTHVRNILSKLGVGRRSAAIREARRRGILDQVSLTVPSASSRADADRPR